MKKKMLLLVVSLVLIVGLQACSTTSPIRQETANQVKATTAMGDENPEMTFLVNKDGEVFFKDEKGDNVGLCRMPGTEASNSDLPVCKVSGQKMTVKAMRAIPILETEGSGCVTVGPDIYGHYWEWCW